MSMRRRKTERQGEFWVTSDSVPDAPRHVFYERLNRLLDESAFDEFVEDLCEPFYADRGRPGIAPGVYFRMLFVGYFEDIDSQRGIAWRCADSLSLRTFLGLAMTEKSPDHSSLTKIKKRLPLDVYDQVFAFVLLVADKHLPVSGERMGVDSTTLEANAAMKSIVRRDSGEDWPQYIRRLMIEEGVIDDDDEPSADDLRRFDRARKNKKVANAQWKAKADDDARIMKMKDGRYRFAYKAEHAVDLQTQVVLSATVRTGSEPDTQTLVKSIKEARENINRSGIGAVIFDVAADKGYHSNDQLVACEEEDIRTYIPEPKFNSNRRWTDKPSEVKSAFHNNRKRVRREKSKQLQRDRSEKVERSFAHVCRTGGARRTWLRGVENINKRYRMVVAAHNLGRVMKRLFGAGKPRAWSAFAGIRDAIFEAITVTPPQSEIETPTANRRNHFADWCSDRLYQHLMIAKQTFSTAC